MALPIGTPDGYMRKVRSDAFILPSATHLYVFFCCLAMLYPYLRHWYRQFITTEENLSFWLVFARRQVLES